MQKKLLLSLVFIASCVVGKAQTLTGMSPSMGARAQSLPIIISGQNTNFVNQGTASLFLQQGSYTLTSGISNVVIKSPTLIEAQLGIPTAAPLGYYDLFVSSGSSTLSKNMAFEVIPPSPSKSVGISPVGSKPGKTTNVTFTVNGANFKKSSQQTIERVWLNFFNLGVISDISNIQVINTTSFSADVVIPANAQQGMWDVNVFTDDGMLYTSRSAFTIDNSFSRSELESNNIKLYPNPVVNELTLELSANYADMHLSITDVSGKLISADSYFSEFGDKWVKINTRQLSSGTYFLNLYSGDELIAFRQWVKK